MSEEWELMLHRLEAGGFASRLKARLLGTDRTAATYQTFLSLSNN